MGSFIDMVGKRCGMLTVISRAQNNKHGSAMWNCLCDCGNDCVPSGSSLRCGTSTSCGCYQVKNASKRSTTHGMSKKRIYRIWTTMKVRCYKPNNKEYKFYGERGISVCEEWKDPSNFFKWAMGNGYKDNLTIERIDCNGNYEPINCTFIPPNEQARNTRRTVRITTNDGYVTAKEAAQLVGVCEQTIGRWYHKGLIKTLEDAKRLANRERWFICSK